MARKRISISRKMLFTWFMLAGFILLFAPQSITNRCQFTFARIFSLPLSIGRNISLSVRNDRPLADIVDRTKYIQLLNHLSFVESQLAFERHRNEQLTHFRKKHPLADAKFVFANIVKSSANELVINCGENSGLAKGQFVLGHNSIIGTISEVSSHTAKVRLVTCPTSQIPVKILNENALLQGTGNGAAKVPFFIRKHKVNAGSEVFCRPAPGFLNSPMIIGRVVRSKVDQDQPLLWDITVEPACDIDSIDYIDVIVMNPPK